MDNDTTKTLIAKYLNKQGLMDKVGSEAVDWSAANFMKLFTAFQMPIGEWAWKTQSDEMGTFNQIPDEIKMAAFVVALQTYKAIFGIDIVKLSSEEDFVLAVWRCLIMIGWAMKEDYDEKRLFASGESAT